VIDTDKTELAILEHSLNYLIQDLLHGGPADPTGGELTDAAIIYSLLAKFGGTIENQSDIEATLAGNNYCDHNYLVDPSVLQLAGLAPTVETRGGVEWAEEVMQVWQGGRIEGNNLILPFDVTSDFLEDFGREVDSPSGRRLITVSVDVDREPHVITKIEARKDNGEGRRPLEPKFAKKISPLLVGKTVLPTEEDEWEFTLLIDS
jgi:hypothetical protein